MRVFDRAVFGIRGCRFGSLGRKTGNRLLAFVVLMRRRPHDGDGTRRFRDHLRGDAAEDAAHAGDAAGAHDEVIDAVFGGVFDQRMRRVAVFEDVYGDAVFVQTQRANPIAQREQTFHVAVSAFRIEIAVQADPRGFHHCDASQARMRERGDDAL